MAKRMETSVKRIGYLPRKRVLEIIDEISQSESISRSKVVGILVEEALGARGIDNFGYMNKQTQRLATSEFYQNKKISANEIDIHEDEFVDDNGYRISNKAADNDGISSSDIELANKINLLKKSGLI